MMRCLMRKAAALVALAFLAGGPACPTFGQQGTDVLYDGTYVLKPNGDMDVTMSMTLPMVHYDKLRKNISNLYLTLRGLASSRADTEIASKKADWDDANRKITYSYTVLGAARNMGNRWEMPVAPGEMFMTFNEKDHTFYFSEAGTGPMGTVRGTTKGVLPPGATDPKWDEARRLVSYVLPAPRTVISGPVMALLIPGVSVAGVGLLLIVVSFLVGGSRSAQSGRQAPGGPRPQAPSAPPLPQK